MHPISSPEAPLYKKIKAFIEEKIATGEWKTGSKIYSEAKLAELFNASRMTVNRAARELTNEGRLIRNRGRGTFVAPVKPQSALLEVNSIAAEIKASGGIYSCEVHLLVEEKASPSLAKDMNLNPYDAVFHSVLVHKDRGVPIQVADRHINPVIAPDYLRQDFTQITPTEYLLQRAPISKVEHVVEALIPEAWIRKLLQINEAEPCLALRRTTWVEELIATKSCFYYPGSRYTLGGRFTPTKAGSIQVV